MGCIANHRVEACVKIILWAALAHFVLTEHIHRLVNSHLGDIFGKEKKCNLTNVVTGLRCGQCKTIKE